MTRSAERRLAVPVQGDPRSPTDTEAAEIEAGPTAATGSATDGVEIAAVGADSAEAWTPEVPAEPSPTIARLADELLPVLIARLEASSLGEIEISRDGWRVRLRRSAAEDPGSGHATQLPRSGERRAKASAEAAGDAMATPSSSGTGAADGRAARPDRDRTVITAPAVGYYVPLDELHVGQSVRGGDLLGHVDVLGLRQEVVVPVDGRVSRLLAEPGEAVEYGQPLARLDPESRG